MAVDYKVFDSYIEIFDPKIEFDIEKTLLCGQVFRYDKVGENYSIISTDKRAVLYRDGDIVKVVTPFPQYFVKYFDLETDYDKIYRELSQFDELKEYVKSGYGIRILRQDIYETIMSFIVSPRNHIPKIRSVLFNMAERFGSECSDSFGKFFAFPSSAQMAKASIEAFRECGAGYRDVHLYKSANVLVDSAIVGNLEALNYDEAKKQLLKLHGVGEKVADCILLFALAHFGSYPVDTWIYKSREDKSLSIEDVRKYYMNRYKNLAGYAQQVVFFGGRNLRMY